MSTYKISDFFNTGVEDQKLIIHHAEGCQTLDFGDAPNLPRQTEILTAMKVLGIDLTKIFGLQYGGKKKYTLYPTSNTPLLTQSEINICGIRVKITEAEPVIR